MASLTDNPPTLVVRQHIQDHAAATAIEKHWGYAERVVPCVVDAGSCEYLDVVYGAHDQGMLFVGIMWIVFGGLILSYAIGRRLIPSRQPSLSAAKGEEAPSSPESAHQPLLYRLSASLSASLRRSLLPESLRPMFGRVTRLQLLILAFLSTYLTIFTFVGYRYATWVTPVSNTPGVYNTRSSLGPFSDRIGVMAYALIPLSVFLANRESLLSQLSGIPYQSFQFLHRWLGYIITVQSIVHTIGWTIVEARLYQPQPKVWNSFIKQLYMIWGVVAMVLLSLIFALSLPCAIRRMGYEAFRKAHYLMAAIFMGACYGHWAQLGCFLIASLVVWFLDRFARLLRTFLLHYQFLPDSTSRMRFQPARARITSFPDESNGDIVRLDFVHNHAAWAVGQHFYLCFPESSIWQSHPFTPLSLPSLGGGNEGQRHSYVFRAKGGETRKIAELARAKLAAAADTAESSDKSRKATRAATTPVILQGPYGTGHVAELQDAPDMNVLLVAGGTGVTFVLPVLFYLMTLPVPVDAPKDRKIELVWAVRRRADVKWVQQELDVLQAASRRMNLSIRIFVTREGQSAEETVVKGAACCSGEAVEKNGVRVNEEAKTGLSSSSSSSETGDEIQEVSSQSPSPRRFSVQQASRAEALQAVTLRPDMAKVVTEFVDSTVRGPTTVYASGPGGLISDLREVVASCNDGAQVWKGHERWSVDLVCDDRMEW
ncbi:uncharacterized protein HMPREF1541_02303 [Cyphellophora europaea CBS 101466]|uniref:FAD-binding FR-type domain-containing protein n=1 Tax=Cyphellophora europaea (strain CBS 101466) TaxID=1220924 RepID=W2S3G0_CYPE1|nr:uncharacterized protein HMPREF1541_02303 [Cyphellophora europaea CBS 101466]ETN43145.1 hypothetical protein HMPREF1541_02303 [Cyphellophora europaea CBS 101466]